MYLCWYNVQISVYLCCHNVQTLKNKDLDQIFQKMNLILLDRFPLVVRRMDFERISNELPSALMERLFNAYFHPSLTLHHL